MKEGDEELTLTALGIEAVAQLKDPPQTCGWPGAIAINGHRDARHDAGRFWVAQGSTVLLRGQPGAGKTTLALQVARSAIQQGHAFVFVAVEEDPDEALNQITESLWSQDLRTFLGADAPWGTFDLTRYWDIVEREQAKLLDEEFRRPLGFEQAWQTQVAPGDETAEALRYVADLRKEMSINESLANLWQIVQALKPFALSPRTLVIIDSLSALINQRPIPVPVG